MRYKITWWDNGNKKEIVSRFFNDLLEAKRNLIREGFTVIFVRSN